MAYGGRLHTEKKHSLTIAAAITRRFLLEYSSQFETKVKVCQPFSRRILPRPILPRSHPSFPVPQNSAQQKWGVVPRS